MKIEDVAFLVAGETLTQLEQRFHYRIPDENKREIQNVVKATLNDILARGMEAAKAPEAEGDDES
jgi:hypothetical protein